MKKYWAMIFIIGIVAVLGFNYYRLNRGVEANSLPAYAQRNEQVEAAYQYTIENPELLENIPCYCNCYRQGHKSVEDCFVKEFKDDEKVVFDEHGAYCGICYYTVLDSKKLSEEGESPQEIREFIDAKYSQYGLPTNTPKP